jgi:hypothetical protein
MLPLDTIFYSVGAGILRIHELGYAYEGSIFRKKTVNLKNKEGDQSHDRLQSL